MAVGLVFYFKSSVGSQDQIQPGTPQTYTPAPWKRLFAESGSGKEQTFTVVVLVVVPPDPKGLLRMYLCTADDGITNWNRVHLIHMKIFRQNSQSVLNNPPHVYRK